MGSRRRRCFLVEPGADGGVHVVHRSYLSDEELAAARQHPALENLGREWITLDGLSGKLSQRLASPTDGTPAAALGPPPPSGAGCQPASPAHAG